MSNRLSILQGDALEKLRELPDESVQCCVTSPPYWGLRDYGTAAWEGGEAECEHKEAGTDRGARKELPKPPSGWAERSQGKPFHIACGKCGARRIDSQLGLEKTPEEYVAKMVAVFREVKRVLRKDGTLWLNMGDSYASSTKGYNNNGERGSTLINGARPHVRSAYNDGCGRTARKVDPGLKEKDLCGIPWMLAFALRADGWYLRSDIIWAKPNPMPESVTDRPTKSHEYLFLLTKSAKYFYDNEAIKEPSSASYLNDGRWETGPTEENEKDGYELAGARNPKRVHSVFNGERKTSVNKRSVWTVTTAPYPEAHFATYPPDLIKPGILAGTSAKGCCAECGAPWERIVKKSGGTTGKSWHNHENDLVVGQSGGKASQAGFETDYRVETLGWQPTCKCADIRYSGRGAIKQPSSIIPCTVLDPFAGSGTTGMVALELGRKAILIELNPAYCKLIERRSNVTPGFAMA
jgi:DNA modification methylase